MIGITSYYSKDERDLLKKVALLRNQSLSSYIKHVVLKDIKNIPSIPTAWTQKAQENGFKDLFEFLNVAVNSYNIKVVSADSSGYRDEIQRLLEENNKLRLELADLKAPRSHIGHIDKFKEKIYSILTDKYITVKELCDAVGVKDEDDYYTFLFAVMEPDIEYNSRFGYRLKKVKK